MPPAARSGRRCESDQIRVATQLRDGERELLAFQPVQEVQRFDRRFRQHLPLTLESSQHLGLVETELVQDERVRVLRLDAERLEHLGREIPQVKRQDQVGVAANGGSEDVSVAPVGQRECVDQRFIARHQCVADM